jgi:short subunit fatty acids transporter
MAQPFSSPKVSSVKVVVMSRPRDGLRAAIVWGLGLVGGGLLAAALALWFHYGTAVFFETIAAGFASCF